MNQYPRRELARLALAWLLVVSLLLLAGCGGGSSAPAAPTATAGGNLSTTPGHYPTPEAQTFENCPAQGDGGDRMLNVRKNRTDVGAWEPVTVASLVSLAYPSSVVKQPRASWSSAGAGAVAQSEGRPVQAEGYLLLVRHEGPESPNCHDARERDFHMWLAANPGSLEDRVNSLIVEVTPRSRVLNSGWQPDDRLLGLAGHHVRISGWLMLDQEHPEQVGKTRGTLWEIHPVMKVEVEQQGQWLDLDNPAVQIHGGSPAPNLGDTPTPSHHRHHKH